jgi:hypothetical protein
MNLFFVALFAFLATYAMAGTIMKDGLNTTSSTCGGNCPGGNCPSCPCGTTKNVIDIATWCSKYSWNQVKQFPPHPLIFLNFIPAVYRLTANAS